MKTPGDRLYTAMKHLGLTQKALGVVLDLSQGSVAAKIKGKTSVTTYDAVKLSEQYHIRVEWLLQGKGAMTDSPGPMVKESLLVYNAKQGVYADNAIGERLGNVVTEYAMKHKLNQGEVAEKWGLDPQYLSNVINGKHISSNMIIAAMQFGGVNLNYLIGGKGLPFLTDRDNSSHEDMRKIVREELQQALHSEKQKKSA